MCRLILFQPSERDDASEPAADDGLLLPDLIWSDWSGLRNEFGVFFWRGEANVLQKNNHTWSLTDFCNFPLQKVPLFIPTLITINIICILYVVACFLPGPSGFLAGNRLHVLGQRADMETAAVISGTTSGAFSAPTSNTNTPATTMTSQHFLFFTKA